MKQYIVLFTKIKNDHARLRTDTMEGVTTELPEVNKQFVIYGKALESGSFRRLNTSIVKSIEMQEDVYMLTTESGSLYSVKILGVVNEETRTEQ